VWRSLAEFWVLGAGIKVQGSESDIGILRERVQGQDQGLEVGESGRELGMRGG